MLTFIVGLRVGIVAGALIARNNIKKLNALVADAEATAAEIEAKMEDLPAKWKKHLGKED